MRSTLVIFSEITTIRWTAVKWLSFVLHWQMRGSEIQDIIMLLNLNNCSTSILPLLIWLSSLMSIEPAESLICFRGLRATEGREIKSWFTNTGWRLAVMSRPALSTLQRLDQLLKKHGLSTAGKVGWCLCLPTHLHSITAAGHSGYTPHPTTVHTLRNTLGLCVDHMGEVWTGICLPSSYYLMNVPLINGQPYLVSVNVGVVLPQNIIKI